jgi:long-chain acyl-CoA synthetase
MVPDLTMPPSTINEALLNCSTRPAAAIAVRFKRHRSWLELTWKDYFQNCEAAGLGLLALGVNKGDRVAVLSNTRFEWAALDFGILGIGAVTVPIYQSSKADEAEWILKHSEAKVLVVEDRAQLKKWEAIGKRCKSVEQVVCIDCPPEDLNGALGWDAFLERGSKFAGGASAFRKAAAEARPETLATIVYTSGTTGEPKGAVLTHEQLISEVEDVVKAFPISAEDSTLCFLPAAHVLGRMELWLHMYLGFTLNFAESIDRLRGNLAETKPTVMIGVPRVFEKIYAGLLTQIEGQAWRKIAFNFLNKHNSWLGQTAADLLLYRKLREGLGGRLRFVVSGGAPLEAQLAAFFNKAGLLLLEGYGLTETTAAICVNKPDDYEFGTVGKPFGDVEIKLADDGEILVRSKKVMKSYYKDESSTLQCFKDGYFCTGDVGVWTSKGFLRITDRKKDLIKTAGGKYVAPQKLEGLLKLNPLISHALIHGDRRKYIVALVTLNERYIKGLADERKWYYRDFKSLVQKPEVKELVRNQVAQVNAQLSSYETIKNFAILPEDFTIDKGELTASLKVRRKVVDEKFKNVIDELY